MMTLARWLRQLADYLHPLPPPPAVPEPEPRVYTEYVFVEMPAKEPNPPNHEMEIPYYQRAKALVGSMEPIPASGEYKRHVVYAQLQKEFPQTAKRHLALAIEQMVQARD
jgi:hypothetical protein